MLFFPEVIKKTANIIESALKHGWQSAIKKNKEYCDSIIYKKKNIDSPLPWDFLDTNVKKEFLAKRIYKISEYLI